MKEAPNFDDLVDIQTVSVDENLPKEERIAEFIRQIKNPFHFKCGKYTVHAEFREGAPSLEESLVMMKSL